MNSNYLHILLWKEIRSKSISSLYVLDHRIYKYSYNKCDLKLYNQQHSCLLLKINNEMNFRFHLH